MLQSKHTPVRVGVLVSLALILGACGSAPATPAASGSADPAGSTAASTAPSSAAASAAASTASTGGTGQTLRIGYGGEIDTLNPLTSQFLIDIHLTMMEGLIVSNDQNEYVPVLATQIPTVENGGVVNRPDGKIDMTWPLQQGVKWHDGVEFTADDVCFTWQFITSENSEVYNRDEYLPISACEAVDPYTAKLTWDQPFAPYNSLFEAILPKHVLEGTDVKTADFNRNPIGTGPFRFVEWRSGEYIRAERNPEYWRGTQYPGVDQIVFTFIPDDNTRLNALQAGEQDWAQTTPDLAKDLQIPGYRTVLVNQNSWLHFDFSVKTERGQTLFGDKRVRQAIAHAIDRQTIANDIMQGTVQVADTVVATNSPYFNGDVPKYPYDVERAQQLLDEAGWTVGTDGIREKDGEKLSFTIMNRAGRLDRIAIAQVIQAQLKPIGVDVQFDTQESAAWANTWRTGNWEAVISGWILPADPSFTSLFACDGGNNMTGLCSPELDELMKASDQELDPAKRKPLLDEAQVKLADEMLSLPLYYNVTPIIASERLGNFKPSGTNLGSFWNVYEWTLTE